jgi:hypothetical protein
MRRLGGPIDEHSPVGWLARVRDRQGVLGTVGWVGAGEPDAGDTVGGGWLSVAEAVGVGVPLGCG